MVISKTETELQNMINRIVKVGRRYGIEINIRSEVMRISKRNKPLSVTRGKSRIGRHGLLQVFGKHPTKEILHKKGQGKDYKYQGVPRRHKEENATRR